jgi:hypothetical protein
VTRVFAVPSVLRHRGVLPLDFLSIPDDNHQLLDALDPLFLLLTLAGYDIATVLVVKKDEPKFALTSARTLEVSWENDPPPLDAWAQLVGTPWPTGARCGVGIGIFPRDLFSPTLSYYDFEPIPLSHPRLVGLHGTTAQDEWTISFTTGERDVGSLIDTIRADCAAPDGLREALIKALVDAAAAVRAGNRETLVGLLPIFDPETWRVRPITGEGEAARSRRAEELTELGEGMQALYLSTSDEMTAFLREESQPLFVPSMADRLEALAAEEDLRASDLEEKARRFTRGVSRHSNPPGEGGIPQFVVRSDLKALSYTRLLMLAQELGSLDMLIDIWHGWQKRQPEVRVPPGLYGHVEMRSVRGQEVRSAILAAYTIWKLYPEKGVDSLRDAFEQLFDFEDGIWAALDYLSSQDDNEWADAEQPPRTRRSCRCSRWRSPPSTRSTRTWSRCCCCWCGRISFGPRTRTRAIRTSSRS